MKILKKINDNNSQYIIAAAVIYILVVMFVVSVNWLTGSHVFDLQLTVSLYVGLHVWSSILYCVVAVAICTLLVIYVLSTRTKVIQKVVYFLIVFGIMGYAWFPCAQSRSKFSTNVHNYFSYELILGVTISLILMIIFSRKITNRIFAIAGLAFAGVFILCFLNRISLFLELLFMWENMFIFILLFELMIEESKSYKERYH